MFDDAVRDKFMLSKREIERKRVAPVQELGLGKLYGVFCLFVRAAASGAFLPYLICWESKFPLYGR